VNESLLSGSPSILLAAMMLFLLLGGLVKMNYSSVISSKGQVTVPQDSRVAGRAQK
jgi:hypothetical protein